MSGKGCAVFRYLRFWSNWLRWQLRDPQDVQGNRREMERLEREWKCLREDTHDRE